MNEHKPYFKKYRVSPMAFVLIRELSYMWFTGTLHRRNCTRVLMTKESNSLKELEEWANELRKTFDKQ